MRKHLTAGLILIILATMILSGMAGNDLYSNFFRNSSRGSFAIRAAFTRRKAS